jgi:hypothetical protein
MPGIEDPVRWLRATYDPGAVETEAQQAMVAAFAAAARSQP